MEGIVFQMLVDSWQLYDNSGIPAVLTTIGDGPRFLILIKEQSGTDHVFLPHGFIRDRTRFLIVARELKG
jgi:hypothetical protein